MVRSSPDTDWREARRESARAAILTAAWALVGDEGLAGLSMRDLAARAGITTPTVYSYFESKDAIYDAMFAQAAEEFAEFMARPFDGDGPRDELTTDARRFVEFCTADVARYQLLFQHAIPGFAPSPASYEPAVLALEHTRAVLARNGFSDPGQLDIWTALMNGLVDQQVANDPGGDRWTRLIDEVVTMFADHFSSTRPPRAGRSGRSTRKGTSR
jgi:AcrR family transcriptional regulator